MSRINTNIQSMVATRVLNNQNNTLNTSLQRLSTGLRINTGADDPAGLIASELLRGEKVAIGAALTNISRANNVVATAEGGLEEVNKLLTELEDLVDRSANEAGISDDERAANQLQIDAILTSINRIANSTEFQGRKLLSGELDYTTSGVSSSQFADVDITGARVANNASRAVVVQVVASAQLAQLNYTSATTAAGGTTTLQIQGQFGTETLSFGSSTAIADVAQAINDVKDLTGVSASVTGAANLRFMSTEYGSSAFVSVTALQGTFSITDGDTGGGTKDYGVDASVLINGTTAHVDGLRARVQTSVLDADLRLTASFGTSLGTTTFHVVGGGADFMISPTVNLNGLASLGVKSVSTGSLGSGATGFLSSLGSGQDNAVATGNFFEAQRIIRDSQTQVAQLRGRLGAFQKNTLDTMANSLNVTIENTTAAESSIRDTDFASETSNLTRSQILVQAATNTLRLANQSPQFVLALLQ
jgi:flagellin